MSVISLKTKQKYGTLLAGNEFFMPSAFESIATVTVSGSAVSSIDFTSIPNTYQHLQIRGIAKTSTAGYVKSVRARLNSDSGTNYTSHYLYGDGSSVISAGPVGTSFMNIADAGAAGSSATSTFGSFIIDVVDYASTSKYKTIRTFNGMDANSGGGEVALNSNLWLSTSAISSITFILDSANFAVGTSIALYGVKGA